MTADESQPARRVRPSVSVMVAAYNEEPGLEAAVLDVLTALEDFDDFEVIVVDDCSRDRTPEIADRLAADHPRVRVIHHPVNMGLAAVYRTALGAATKDYFTWVAGDHEITLQSIRDLVNAIGKADLVVPYPSAHGERVWYRRLLTWFATSQVNLLFGYTVPYYQGPTVYPRRLALSLPVESNGFFFASEMLIRALTTGSTWVAVGIRHKGPQPGISHAVKPPNLFDAQLSVLRLWGTLRVFGIGASIPVPPCGPVDRVI